MHSRLDQVEGLEHGRGAGCAYGARCERSTDALSSCRGHGNKEPKRDATRKYLCEVLTRKKNGENVLLRYTYVCSREEPISGTAFAVMMKTSGCDEDKREGEISDQKGLRGIEA